MSRRPERGLLPTRDKRSGQWLLREPARAGAADPLTQEHTMATKKRTAKKAAKAKRPAKTAAKKAAKVAKGRTR